jgi:hypothetical protein
MGQKIDLTQQVQGVLPEANGGAGPNIGLRFSDGEVPSGVVNGSNTTFTLANPPNPAESLLLFLVLSPTSRVLQIQGTDYTLSGSTITMGTAPSTGSFVSWYRYLKFGLTLNFSDGLVLSDALAVDAPAARLPLGMVDQLVLSDSILFTLGPIVFMDHLIMSDAFAFVGVISLSFSDTHVQSDAFSHS